MIDSNEHLTICNVNGRLCPSCLLLYSQFNIVLSHVTVELTKSLQTQAIRVITKLPNSEQSYKGKVKTHNYINRQNQSTTGKL